MKLLLFKLFATTLVTAILAYPFIDPSLRTGVFASVAPVGILGVLALTTLFLLAVALYCRSLQHCLQLVQPEARAVNPKSVWFMFLIPYNFVEDFFIINNINKSLRIEARINPRLSALKSVGALSGFGWCTAQIVSLLPNHIGEAASVVAIIFWVMHWRLIARVNKLLSVANPRISLAPSEG